MRDDRTNYLNLPLPSGQNTLDEDLPRLRQAFAGLDAKAQAQDVAKADKYLDGQTVVDPEYNYKRMDAELVEINDKFAALHGSVGYLQAHDFGDPAEDEDWQATLTDYAIGEYPGWEENGVPNAVAAKNLWNNHIWIYNTTTSSWTDNGLGNVAAMTNQLAGILKGKSSPGYVYAEVDDDGDTVGRVDISDASPDAPGLVKAGGQAGQIYGVNAAGTAYEFRAAASGIPLLFPFWSYFAVEPGALNLSVNNGLLSRSAYPDAWAEIARLAGAGGPVLTDSAWQAKLAADGAVNAFSKGNGSTTFRLPLLTKRVSFAAPEAGKAATGDFLPDRMRPITGLFGQFRLGSTTLVAEGAFSHPASPDSLIAATGTGRAPCTIDFDSARLGDAYDGDITHGPLVVLYPHMRMYGTPASAGQVDIAAALQGLAGKLDASTYTADAPYRARAWASLGTNGEILSAYGVASSTRTTTGTYAIVLSPSMPNTKYAVVAGGTGDAWEAASPARTVSGFTILTKNSSGTLTDYTVSFAVFR
jgi:hypothetical protein